MTLAYGRPEQETTEIPVEIAVMIVRKACRMAEKIENQAIDDMIKQTRQLLRQGMDHTAVVCRLGL